MFAFAPLLGDGIFNSDGARWANSRHLLRPNFAREQVADLGMLDKHFKLMMKFIPKDGSTVDLQELFFCMTMDTATEFLFNHSTNSLKMMDQATDNEDTIFAKAFNFAQADIIVRLRYGPFDRFRKNKEGKEAIRICHEYVDKWVDDAVSWREAQKTQAVDLENKGILNYVPEKSFDRKGFCWASIHHSQNENVLVVEGCFWAAEYEIVFYDFSNPLQLPYKEIKRVSPYEEVVGWKEFGLFEYLDEDRNIKQEKVLLDS